MPGDVISTTDRHADDARLLGDLAVDMAVGLTSAAAAALLTEVGPNELPVAKKDGIIKRVIAQITNPLIYVLLGSATISLLLGHFVDSAVILAVVVINAGVGILQEGRAEKALDAIRSLLSPARVGAARRAAHRHCRRGGGSGRRAAARSGRPGGRRCAHRQGAQPARR